MEECKECNYPAPPQVRRLEPLQVAPRPLKNSRAESQPHGGLGGGGVGLKCDNRLLVFSATRHRSASRILRECPFACRPPSRYSVKTPFGEYTNSNIAHPPGRLSCATSQNSSRSVVYTFLTSTCVQSAAAQKCHGRCRKVRMPPPRPGSTHEPPHVGPELGVS